MRRILTITSGLVLALSTSAAQADLSSFWDNVLATEGVVPNETQIRVVFVTSATIDGNGETQSYYDNFGDVAAANGVVTGGLGLSGDQWRPLVSTQEAFDSGANPVSAWLTDEDGSNAMVFNTAGQLVATSGSNMLRNPANPNDSVDMSAAIGYDESADDQARGGLLPVWTGTNADGTPGIVAPNDAGEPAYLGSERDDGPNLGMIGDGGAGNTFNDWLQGAAGVRSTDPGLEDSGDFVGAGDAIQRPIYMMSGDITVVPEPSTVLLWLGCSGLAGLFFWRKRRRS